jgi:hypothetical protein
MRRSSGQTQGDLARHYQPDRQPLKRRRPSRIQYKGGLPSLRKLPAVATVVAKQASKPGTHLGLDVVLGLVKLQAWDLTR